MPRSSPWPRRCASSAEFIGHVSGATRSATRASTSGCIRCRPSSATRDPEPSTASDAPSRARHREALEIARGARAALGRHARSWSPTTQRAGYHAAASIASNFLVTLQAAAERIAAASGLQRDRFRAPPRSPRAQHRRELGGARPRAALTGPIARGDEATVARQRAASRPTRRTCSRCSTPSPPARARSPRTEETAA